MEYGWDDEGHYDTGWYVGHESDPVYFIKTAEELAGFAHLVNDGNTFSNKTLILENDIDLSGKQYCADGLYWAPISNSDNTEFYGKFDGNHKTISNLMIRENDARYVGLFGRLAGSEIYNVSVNGNIESIISNHRDLGYGAFVGGIAGFNSYGSKISGCNNDCTIKLIGTQVKNTTYLGGIAGGSGQYADIDNCRNTGNLICDIEPLYSYGNYIGGISGDATLYCTIDHSSNSGDITVVDKDYIMDRNIGGITGWIDNSWVANSCNTGIVSVNNPENRSHSIAGLAAGFVVYSLSPKPTFVNNGYNRGSVSGNKGIYHDITPQDGYYVNIQNGYSLASGESSGQNMNVIDSVDSSVLVSSTALKESLADLNAWVDIENAKPDNISNGISYVHWEQNDAINDGFPYLMPGMSTLHSVWLDDLTKPVTGQELATTLSTSTLGVNPSNMECEFYKIVDGTPTLVTGITEPNTIYQVKCIIHPQDNYQYDDELICVWKGQIIPTEFHGKDLVLNYTFPATANASRPAGGATGGSTGGSTGGTTGGSTGGITGGSTGGVSQDSTGGASGGAPSGVTGGAPAGGQAPTQHGSTQINVPIMADETVDLAVEMKDAKTAAIDITSATLKKIIHKDSKLTTLTLNLSKLDKSITSVQLSLASMKAMKEIIADKTNAIHSITIQFWNAAITLDQDTIITLAAQTSGTTIQLIVKSGDKSILNTKQQKAVKDMDVLAYYEASMLCGGKAIGDLKDGKITITTEYKPSNNADPNFYHVICIHEEGKATKCATTYENNMITFATSDLSDFVITYDTKEKNENVSAQDEPARKVQFQTMAFRETKATKNTLSFKWKQVKDADGYIIYGAPYGSSHKMTKVKTITKNTSTSFTATKLKAGVSYKYMICAYKLQNNKKVIFSKSVTVRALTAGNKSFINPSSIKTDVNRITISVNETYDITATVQKAGNKKLTGYASKLSYESDDESVATVTSNGTIKAIAAGTCNIYVYASNGRYTKIMVTVK